MSRASGDGVRTGLSGGRGESGVPSPLVLSPLPPLLLLRAAASAFGFTSVARVKPFSETFFFPEAVCRRRSCCRRFRRFRCSFASRAEAEEEAGAAEGAAAAARAEAEDEARAEEEAAGAARAEAEEEAEYIRRKMSAAMRKHSDQKTENTVQVLSVSGHRIARRVVLV